MGIGLDKMRRDYENDQLNLRNLVFFLDVPISGKEDDTVFYNLQIPSSMQTKCYREFLDKHFAGYLTQPKNKNMICDIPLDSSQRMADARSDIMIGRQDAKGKGGEIRKEFIRKINAKKYQNGCSHVIDEMEEQNRELLLEWQLNEKEVKQKLNRFINRMQQESTDETELIPMPAEIRREVLGFIQNQVYAGTTLESMAVPITWLLLVAFLRGEISCLKDYYINMGKKPENDSAENENSFQNLQKQNERGLSGKAKYSNPDEIRPFTMEQIGNMRNTYVKREQMLDLLYRKIHVGSENSKKFVFISAMGGEGKTELARAYAYTFRDEYDEIFWFTCENEEMTGLEKLLENSMYSSTVTPKILNSLNERVLLILDNCNTVSRSALIQLTEKTGKAHILITTRLAAITQISSARMLFLKSSEEEKENFACQIFAANYLAEPHDFWHVEFGEEPEESSYLEICAEENDEKISENRMDLFSEEEQSDIRTICNRICNHPMTAAIVAVMLRENKDCESIKEFANKCRRGLQYAFPSYEIPFGQGEKDYEEKPETILKALFSSFPKREFTEAEKKLLTVLQMVPAKQMDMKYITELLGDNEFSKEIKNACRTLCSLNWLQSNGVWITMHPLLSQILEWDHKRILFDAELEKIFYREVMENWMLSVSLDEESMEYRSYLGYRIWEKSGIMEEPSNLNLALRLLINRQNAKEYLESMKDDLTCALTAIVYGDDKLIFVCYDLQKKEEKTIYSLRSRKKRMQKRRKEAELLFLTCKEEQMELQFPNELAGSPILEIPDNFCDRNLQITSLKLPEELEKIGNNAFCRCRNISGGLELPESLEKLGDGAFRNCEKLSGGLIIHGNLKEIGEETFSECGLDGELIIEEGVKEIKKGAFLKTNITGCLQFPNSLEIIGDEAFLRCNRLTGIELQEGLKYIGSRAFWLCANLNEKLELPNTLQKIEDMAFYGCSQLCGELKIPESIIHIGEIAFGSCEQLTGELIIPPSIKVVEDGVFSGCRKIRISEKTFHDKVEAIRDYSFRDCFFDLKKIKLPDSLHIIGNYAFSSCKGLRRIEFGNGLETIESGAFYNCSDLESISFSANLKVIENQAFEDCISLQEVSDFSDSLEYIGHHAFSGCLNLKGNICFPGSLKALGNYAFANCRSLTGKPQIPRTLDYFGNNVFFGCEQLDLSEIKVWNKQGSHINETGELMISSNITELSSSWLYIEEEQLDETIKIPDHITKIEKRTFADRELQFESIILPSALEEIGEYAFFDCYNLKKISPLPSGIKRIKEYAFQGCDELRGIDNLPSELEEIGENAFCGCKLLFDRIAIPEAIEKINVASFLDCISLTEVIFSKKLKEIGECAFLDCTSLKHIQFFNQLRKIDQYAFSGCASLNKVVFPGSLTEIGDCAFFECTSLEKIHFSEGLREIGPYAFAGDTSLHGILELPKSLEKVGNHAFAGCHFSQIVIKNPNMEFEELCDNDNLVIWGYDHSPAFEYAIKNKYEFRSITEWYDAELLEEE